MVVGNIDSLAEVQRSFRQRMVIEFHDFSHEEVLSEDDVRALMQLFDIKDASLDDLITLVNSNAAIEALLPWSSIIDRIIQIVDPQTISFGAVNGRLRSDDLERLRDRAHDLSRLYAPIRFVKFEFELPEDDGNEAREALVSLAADLAREGNDTHAPKVFQAYVERPPTAPPSAPPPETLTMQEFLREAPIGIDALYAWGLPGGQGEDSGFADVEYGWNLSHPDLPHIDDFFEGQYSYNDDADAFRDHGTAMLGITCAQHNGVYGQGIAPRARVQVVSQLLSLDTPDLPGAIEFAAMCLERGDVLLIEAQTEDDPSSQRLLPVEVERAVFNAIRFAVNLSVIVVEPAGNSGENLDALRGAEDFGFVPDEFRGHILDPTDPNWDPQLHDSGAIVVGASTLTRTDGNVSHPRWVNSNHGNRIDCFAHGHDEVGSLTSNPTIGFAQKTGGTSAAAAIVAGAAVLVQSIYKARYSDGTVLSPSDIRGLLRQHGTEAEGPDRIGRMPDLRRVNQNIHPAADQGEKPATPSNLGKVVSGPYFDQSIPSQKIPRIVTLRAERLRETQATSKLLLLFRQLFRPWLRLRGWMPV